MALIAGWVLVGCRADIEVVIDIAPDGGGTVAVAVAFDEEVLAAVPDLDGILRLDDARASGWVIDQERRGGGLVVTLVKEFVSIDQLAPLLQELDGPTGVFRGAAFTAGRQGDVVEYELRVSLELERPVAELVEPAVAAVLDGEPLGLPVAELERQAGRSLDDTVSLVVRATVPGGTGRFPEVGSAGLADGGRHELVVNGQVADEAIAAADQAAQDARRDVSRAMTVAVVALGLAVSVGVVVVVSTRHRRPPRPTI